MKNVIAMCLVVGSVLGCCWPKADTPAPAPAEDQPQVKQTVEPVVVTTTAKPVDMKLVKWRERVTAYLDDARSVANLTDNGARAGAIRKKIDGLQETLSRIPDGSAEVFKMCKNINIECTLLALEVNTRDVAFGKVAEKWHNDCKQRAGKIREIILEIEKHPLMQE